MESREILRMAFGSRGVNKLRSFLTMSGISIGVFSVSLSQVIYSLGVAPE
jgi:hypothetical protein